MWVGCSFSFITLKFYIENVRVEAPVESRTCMIYIMQKMNSKFKEFSLEEFHANEQRRLNSHFNN